MAINFKSDDSFLQKLAVGAAGTNATIARLREIGFNPIELERGSTGFKIWKKIKIKRVRVPDILCLNTGLRFESRGKTKLEISMSHSTSKHEREWDFGMRDDDYVSIVVLEQKEEDLVNPTRISPVHFVRVSEMRSAYTSGQVIITEPKGAEEGSERRLLWTCAAANQQSVVTKVDADRICLKPIATLESQSIHLRRRRKNGSIILHPLIHEGESVEKNQIVAAIVPVSTLLPCPPTVDESYFIDKLASVNLSERYAAAKALRYRGYTIAAGVLEDRVEDHDEDIYVKLEAAAALAAYDNPKGWEFIHNKLHAHEFNVALDTQLETVIVASEIPKSQSEFLLIEVLSDSTRDSEVRAGAAWALGQFASPSSANALLGTFNSSPSEIKVEAARALLRIAEPQLSHVVSMLQTVEPEKRDGISWALARTGKFNPAVLLNGADDELRRWVSYIIGFGKENFVPADIESICESDKEVYFAASVLWQIVSSWVNDLREY